MNADAASKEQRSKDVDLWRIPNILSVEAVHVRHRKPVLFYIKSKPAESRETIEFLVKTSEDFPDRALSPALFVGDYAVTEVSRVEKNVYRFVVPESEIGRLKRSAPISIGWAGTRAKPVRTKDRFQVQREEAR